MDVGKPQREILVEPIELPAPLRSEPVPDHVPDREPSREPEREPVHDGWIR